MGFSFRVLDLFQALNKFSDAPPFFITRSPPPSLPSGGSFEGTLRSVLVYFYTFRALLGLGVVTGEGTKNIFIKYTFLHLCLGLRGEPVGSPLLLLDYPSSRA